MLMKKITAYMMVVFLSFSTITYTPKVEATGIPTVDIASLVQGLFEYAQMLSDYAEQLYQSQVVANEYMQKLAQMEQIYREYEHTLNQIKGLADYVDNQEWKEILSRIEIDFPLNPLDSHWDDWGVAILTDDGVIDVDDRIGNAYDRIRNLDEVFADIETVWSSADVRDQQKEDARRHFLKSREVTEQAYAVEVFKSQSKNLDLAKKKMVDYRIEHATKDETELSSLQTLAMQQELQIEILKTQNDLLLKQFEMANQEAIDRKARESYAYDMQLLDKLEISQATKYVADDSRTSSASF